MGFRVVKDLVVDMEPFFAQYRSVLPFFINDSRPPERERLQSIEERERFDDTTKCILCAACTTSLPLLLGQRGVRGAGGDRQRAPLHLRLARHAARPSGWSGSTRREGVWRCRTIFNCTEACPRDIQITKAIGEVKKAILYGQLA